jgi:hypothetical protein
MTCLRCRYGFVLDPKVSPRLSDQKVVAAVRRVSAGDTRPITVNQVLGNLVRHRRLKLGPIRATADRRAMAGAAAVISLRARKAVFPTLITVLEFDRMPAQNWPEPDLFDYGAERILVVDDARLVDLLVRAGVHLDTSAAIVSWYGYPARVWSACRRLVADRPDVPVYVLHGSAHGGPLADDRTRRLLGIPPASRVTDIGLPQDAARRIRPLRKARGLGNVPADFLPPAFLYGAIVESLAADRNEQPRSVEPEEDLAAEEESEDVWRKLGRAWRDAEVRVDDSRVDGGDGDFDGDLGGDLDGDFG